MNNVTPYEILIAEKAGQLPVPDMADSIWASIELQLDADLPGDDNGPSGSDQPNPPISPRGGGLGLGKGLSLFVTLSVMITTFLLTTRPRTGSKENAEPSLLVPKEQRPSVAPDNVQQTPVQQRANSARTPLTVSPASTDPVNNTIDDESPLDNEPPATAITPTVSPDSSVAIKDNIPPAIIDTATAQPPPKKPRGVKGITTNDYRISSKPDSVKKKD